MLTANGCVKHQYRNKGKIYPPKKCGDPGDWVKPGETCHDCGAKHGFYHHPGCDVERCSQCGGQFISCRCADESIEMVILPEDLKALNQ